MKNYRQETHVVDILDSITCDVCKKTYDNPLDYQEFLQYKDTAGYGANWFQDMDSLELDLCEKCKFELLGKYIRVTEYDSDTEWEIVSENDKMIKRSTVVECKKEFDNDINT
jgi:hypothetical protein